MKSQGKRPSPSLVISLLALFVALGGTAWATHKIGSSEIKPGAVTAPKLKNGAVSTAKLKNGAVTSAKIAAGAVGGAQVDESTLGTVPTAAEADSADRAKAAEHAATADHATTADQALAAEHAQTATNAANFDRFVSSPLVKASVGQEVTIMQRGPFTFVGHCVNGGGGAAAGLVVAITSEPGTTFSNVIEHHEDANFNPGEENRVGPEVASVSAATNDETGGSADRFTALSANGAIRLTGEATAAVNYFGAACAFWGWTLNSG